MSIRYNIESDCASIVVLSREAYDALQTARATAAQRAAALVDQRDEFLSEIAKGIAKQQSRGYTLYWEPAEVLEMFCRVFKIDSSLAEALLAPDKPDKPAKPAEPAEPTETDEDGE